MNDAVLVGMRERLRDFDSDLQRLGIGADLGAIEPRRLSSILHHQIRGGSLVADVVQHADVWMRERS
jgi:hypothetical protein